MSQQYQYQEEDEEEYILKPAKMVEEEEEDEEEYILVKPAKMVKVNENAKTPSLETPFSAAFDLFSAEDITLEKNKTTMVDTGLKIQLPIDMCARILSRSSMALKNITVEAGLIDNDYRGVIKVLLCNRSEFDYVVKTGDKIAQLKFEKYYNNIDFDNCDELDEIIGTNRNEKVFG